MLNISAKKFKILFNNVDYTESVIDSVKFEVVWDEYSGLSLASGSVSLFKRNETTHPITPENNPNIFIGGTCIYEEWDYTTNQYVRHSHFGYTLIQTVPRIINSPTSYYIEAITIELSCKLNYFKEKQAIGDCTGIIPGQNLTRRQIINNLLIKASGGTGLLNDSTEPSDLISYPPEAQKSIVETVGLLALMTPNQPWFVWADGQGRFRLSRESDALANNISLSYALKNCATQHLDSGDFGRPFSELKVNSVIQKTNITNTVEIKPSEEFIEVYMAVGSEFGSSIVLKRNILAERREIKTETDFETYANITTTYKTTVLVINRGNGGVDRFTANSLPANFSENNIKYGANQASGVDYSFVLPTNSYVITNTIVEEKINFFSKPANWDSCNPENNPVSLAGLVSNYSKKIQNYDLAAKKLELQLDEVRSYTYDAKRWLKKRVTSISVLTKKEGTFFTRDGRPIEKFSKAFGKTETWEQLSCDKWRQTVIETGPGGDADATARYDSQISTSPPKITEDSPPSADIQLPPRYTVCEESLTVTANITVNSVFNKTKTISLPFATSKEQLEALAKNRLQLTYQKAFGGMGFEISSTNPYFSQINSTPIFSILFTEPDNKIAKFRALRYIYEANFDSSVVVIDSAKTAVTNSSGSLVDVGNVRDNTEFILAIGGSIETSAVSTPKITVDVEFILKANLVENNASWFTISRDKWFSSSTSEFFSISR